MTDGSAEDHLRAQFADWSLADVPALPEAVELYPQLDWTDVFSTEPRSTRGWSSRCSRWAGRSPCSPT